MATQRKSNRAQAQIDALYNQTLEIQKQVGQEYRNRGLAFDKTTGKAVPGMALNTPERMPASNVPRTSSPSSATLPSVKSITPATPADLSGDITALSVPEVPRSTGFSNILNDTALSSEQTATERARNEALQFAPDAKSKSELDTVKKTIYERLFNRKGQTELTSEAYRKEVDPAQKELDDIQNQIRSKSLSYRRQIEDAQNNATGMTRAGVAGTVAEIERQGSRELADLSIIEQSKMNNYSTAKEIADRQVAAEMEQDTNELNAIKYWYDTNKAEYDKQEQRQFEFFIGERSRLLQEEAQTKQQISQIKLQAAQYGATGSDLAKIGQAKNFDEAIALSAQFLGKPFALQMQAQAFQESMQKSALANELNKTNQEALKDFSNSDEAKNITVVQGQKNAMDSVIKGALGTSNISDSEGKYNLTDEQYNLLSKDDAARQQIANALVRVKNPETARLADANVGDNLQALNALIDSQFKQLKNKGVKVKEAMRTVQDNYNSRMKDADNKLKQFQQAYPNSPILYSYQQQYGSPIRVKVGQALQSGATAQQIVDFYKDDPLLGQPIQSVLGQGLSAEDIIDYLNSL